MGSAESQNSGHETLVTNSEETVKVCHFEVGRITILEVDMMVTFGPEDSITGFQGTAFCTAQFS